jgi:transcription antitermination factor NusG
MSAMEKTSCIGHGAHASADETATDSSAPARQGHGVQRYAGDPPAISSKSKWGGARANSGGARPNSGGARPGAGRKPSVRPVVPHADYGADKADAHWYVAECSGTGSWALENLIRSGYDAWIPMVEVRRVDSVLASIWHVVEEPLWPGYVLVRFRKREDHWQPILRQPGVRCLLGPHADSPTPLEVEVLDIIRAEQVAHRVVRSMPLLADGVELVITEGAFADIHGVCLWSSDTRVRIAAKIFGGLRQVTVARASVKPA